MRTSQAMAGMLLVLLTPGFLRAQADRGTVRGTVLDPSSAIVAGANVTAVNEGTGVRTATVTTGLGNYNIPNLTAGLYRVEVEGGGFKKLIRDDVRVNAGVVIGLDLQLEIGETTESVTVTGQVPQLEKETSDIRTTINPQTFADLPLAVGTGRNPTAFVFLSPGTRTAPNLNAGSPFMTPINGGQTLSGEVEVDGMSVNYPPAQGQADAVGGIAPEAIQEVSIISSGASAEFKGGTGTQRYLIRSGTNQFHGNVYEFLRNDLFDARPFFAATRPKARRNEFGGSVGGPISIPKLYKGTDRSFFFVNFQGFRLRTTPATTTTTVPTAAFKRGDFSELKDAAGNLIQLYDPLTTRPDEQGGFTRDPFPGNIIPQGRISSVSRNVMSYIPDPNRPGIFNNFLGTSPSPTNQNSLTFKIDHRLSTNHSMNFSWTQFDRKSTSGSIFGDPDGALQNGLNRLTHRTTRWGYDWVMTPRLINHLALGYNRRNRQSRWQNPQPWNVVLGMKNMNTSKCSWPGITFEGTHGSPYQQLGRGTGDPAELDVVNSYILSDSLSWVKGKNNFKFGVEIRNTRLNYLTPTGCGGFAFSRTETGFPSVAQRVNTGDSFASFLLGAVDSSGWGINDIGLSPRWDYYAGFVQDDIKLTPNFTLNVGLRWDFYLPFYDAYNNYSIMDPNVPNPAAGGIRGALIFAGDGQGRSGRRRLTNGLDRNNFGPHLGFAWSPRSNLVIRAGNTMNFFPSYPYGTGNFRGIAMGFTTGAGIGTPDQGRTPAFYWDNGFPLTIPRPPFIDSGFLVGQGVASYYSEAHKLSYINQWNLNIQYEFAPNWKIDVGYVGSAGNRLISGMFLANQLDPKYLALGELLTRPINDPLVVAAGFRSPYPNFIQSFPNTPSLAQSLRPFPQYADVSTGPNNGPGFSGSAIVGHSTYHSFQTKMEKQMSEGLFVLTAFTWSKKITDSDSSWGGFFSPNPRDTYNRKIEKALAPSNPPYRLTTAFNYELPIGPRKKFVNVGGPVGKVLEGWQLNGIVTYQSGFPIVVDVPNALPLFNARNVPNLVPGQDIVLYKGGKFDPRRDRYLNVNAFAIPAPFTFGTAPSVLPNARDFALLNEDFGLMKRTYFKETANVEFRFEMYNVFNRVRFATPNVNRGQAGFGTVGGQANSPRVIQFALKINF